MGSTEHEATRVEAADGRPSWPGERDAALRATRARLFGEDVPRRLGRYILLERVGSGGMGVVWSAYDPELDRRVAIKLVAAGRRRTGERQEERSRLLREAQAAARLAHPNVVTVHDIGTYDPGPDDDELGVFVVMELIRGRTLAAWLQEAPRSWREIVDVFVDAGLGLAAAHTADLVHRDFKPQNVMVDDDGRARVLDFGLARLHPRSRSDDGPEPADSSTELTRTGTVVGTPVYMAPEQHDGREIDARADQFAFCVALWEALHAARPFTGTLRELAAAKQAGALAAPAGPRRIPPALDRVIRRGLAPDPDARFPSMPALLGAISRARGLRRRGAAWSGVALFAVTAAAFVLTRPGPEVCEGPRDALAQVWNDGARASVESAFAATATPGASASATAALSEIDGYAGKWTELREQACRDLARADEADRPVFVRRSDCLDARLRALDEVTRVLAGADGAVVQRAARVVGSLPALDPCLDDAALLSQRMESAEEAGTVERLLLRVRTNRHLDRFDEAAAAASEVVELARQLHHQPTEARGLIALAWAYEGEKDFEQAEPALRRAWEISEAHGLHSQSMRAALDLGGVLLERGRCSESLDLLAVVDAKARYVDASSEGTRADIDFVRGRALACVGRFGSAIALLEETLTRRERVFGRDHVAVAWVAEALADVYDEMGREPEATRSRARARRIREASEAASSVPAASTP